MDFTSLHPCDGQEDFCLQKNGCGSRNTAAAFFVKGRYTYMKASRQDIYNAVIRRMVQEALTARHEAFADFHESDSDEQLLAYLRASAKELGHTPHQKELIGWPMIIRRFGTWGEALRRARLPFPRTPNAPATFAIVLEETETQKRIYREKKVQKKRLTQQRQVEQLRKRQANVPAGKV